MRVTKIFPFVRVCQEDGLGKGADVFTAENSPGWQACSVSLVIGHEDALVAN